MASTLRDTVLAAIDHSERWGVVWFGLIFWGSVLNALGPQLLPGVPDTPRSVGLFAVGLAVGLVAKLRGRWL